MQKHSLQDSFILIHRIKNIPKEYIFGKSL